MPGKLSRKQTKMLSKHSKHHSKSHMKLMRNMMKRGSSFKKAHNAAMKMVGS